LIVHEGADGRRRTGSSRTRRKRGQDPRNAYAAGVSGHARPVAPARARSSLPDRGKLRQRTGAARKEQIVNKCSQSVFGLDKTGRPFQNIVARQKAGHNI
jgi:hypothetical protein